MEGKTCAIYIDGDNFKYNGISELFNYIKKWNLKVLHKVVYGDFSETSMLNWRDVCLDYNLTSIHLWKKHSKNSVDMKMSCDIQELLYTRNYNIDIFILCTGDRDFVPIIEKIHTQEKIVIGMSTNCFGTSSMFKNECDQFYALCLNSNEADKKVDKTKTYKSYRTEDIKKDFESLDLDTFFKNDTREAGEYMQKLKNIIKNGKYVSVLRDIVKTPDEKNMVKKVINDMNENPQLITKLKSVSKDVNSLFPVLPKISKLEGHKNIYKSMYKEYYKNEKDKKNLKIKTKEKKNKLKFVKKSEFKKNRSNNLSIEKSKSTQLFESENIDDILNNIDFEEITYKEDKNTEENDYSFENIKDFIIHFLKKENKLVFVSKIKDEILRVYPKFSEKDFGFNGFSSFIKELGPEVKTESKEIGILKAYL